MIIQEIRKTFGNYFGFNPPMDMMMTAIRGPQKACVDILTLDMQFAQRDSEYNPDKCTYKGKEGYSMREYITEKFGEDACKFLELVI